MSHTVVFSPEAAEQLEELRDFIAAAASPAVAAGYVEAIIDYCESLRDFPLRGHSRDDIRPGLRITHYRKRAVVAFSVDAARVSILGVFYGGRDYESLMDTDDTDAP